MSYKYFIYLFILSVSFIILFSSRVHAANGDITAVRILDNGWMAEIDIQGFKTNGSYNFGLGTNNDPSNATVVFTVTSEGYNSSGNLGILNRTVYGTYWIRKAYPNDALKDESNNTENVTLKIALSDFIYADDKQGGVGTSGRNASVSIASRFYYDNATGGSNNYSLEISNFSVLSNSSLSYPKVIGRWAWPGFERLTSDFLVEAVAFQKFARNGKPVAAVLFTANDRSNNSVSSWVTNMNISTRRDINNIQVYATTIDIDSLNQGEIIDVNFVAYPWVGDASSILNSTVGADGVTQPDERLGPLHELNDKTGAYGIGYSLVSNNTGNDTTGTVYPNQSSAESGNAYATIEKAAEGLKTYHNSNYGRNTAAGGIILLAEGNHVFPGTTPANLGSFNDTWMIIKPASSATKANTFIRGGTNVQFQATRLKIEGLTFSNTTGVNTLRGRTASDVLWLNNNTISLTQTAPFYSFQNAYATQNDITALSGGFQNFGATKMPYALIRGNNVSRTLIPGDLYAILGNKNIQAEFNDYNDVAGHKLSNNSVYAFNSAYNITSPLSGSTGIALYSNTTEGIAIIQNVAEKTNSVQPIFQIAADNSENNTNNVLLWHNTFVGERTNLGYNTIGNLSALRTNWGNKFNIFQEWNNKADTFTGTGQSPNRTGSWAVGYNVGSLGYISLELNFRGEFDGLSTIWGNLTGISADFISDKSYVGTIEGDGNYSLNKTSIAIDIASGTSSLDQTLPYDFLGNSIYGSPDAGAYEYQPPNTMGSNQIKIYSLARIYGDEKWRYRTETTITNNVTNFSVSISGSDTSQWLDVNVTLWDNTGARHKIWIETSTASGLTNTSHVIGDLVANTDYKIKVDDATQNILGTNCNANICTSNGTGFISFNYTGTYSTHTFDVLEYPVISLISPINKSGSSTGNITLNYNVTSSNNIKNCTLILNNLINMTNSTNINESTQNFTITNLGIGSYNWSVNCTDTLNNTASSTVRLIISNRLASFDGSSTDLTQVDVSNISNFVIEKVNYGKINFSQLIDLSNGSNLDNHVNISFNRIFINSTAIPALNKSAKLVLTNLTFTTPRILKDREVCSSDTCSQESYTGGTLTFNVTSFSEYAAEETPTSSNTISSTSSSNEGSLNYYPTKSDLIEGYTKVFYKNSIINFFAGNYTHDLTIKEITANNITVIVRPTPQIVILSIGDEEKFELTGDSYYDLSVKLNNLQYNLANLTIKYINDSILTPPLENGIKKFEPISEEEPKKLNYILIILLIFIIICLVFYLKRKKH